MEDLKARVTAVLQHHRIAGQDEDIVRSGVIRALSVSQGTVSFVMELPRTAADQAAPLRERLTSAVQGLDGVTEVKILTSTEPPAPEETGAGRIPGVRHTVLIGSGKGGVGKSTVTAYLARALVARGLKVGILDADLYGPSQPSLLGTSGRPVSYDGTLIPIASEGIKLMSMGLLTDPDQALIWRGPVLHETLQQMLFQVRWDPLDILLIDLPPGTGDVPLSIVQQLEVDGAVLVSTPHTLSMLDLMRAIDLFRRTDVPIFGLVENMAVHQCKTCGSTERVFGDGLLRLADQEDLSVLTSLPLWVEFAEQELAQHRGEESDAPSPGHAEFAALGARITEMLSSVADH